MWGAGPAGWGRLLQGRAATHSGLPGPLQECLSRLLSPCGPVQTVELHGKPELAEGPKEPKSKFFHPKPVPVSLQALGSSGMGAVSPAWGAGGAEWQWDVPEYSLCGPGAGR